MANAVIWIKEETLSWYSYSEGGSVVGNEQAIRAYEIWNHAESISQSNSDNFHRTDVITTLKRCLNQRLKLIEKLYNLKKIPNSFSSKKYLEYLETFGIIRPLMLTRLMTIRNNIEHHDFAPPDADRCFEMLDFVWYFLKSTDQIVKVVSNSLIFQEIGSSGDETPYWLSAEINYYLNHNIKLRGWLPPDYITGIETPDYLEIKVTDLESKKDRFPNNSDHKDKQADDIYFSGDLVENNIVTARIVKAALNAPV